MIKKDWIADVTANGEVDVETIGGYTFEQVMSARNVSKESKYWYRIQGTEKFLFKSATAESWEFTLPNEINPIRNMKQVWLKFLDSYTFLEPATHFDTHGKYTFYPANTSNYDRYWSEQHKYCIYGKVVDGVRISGRHYFMLNFTRMQARFRLKDKSWSSDKIETFPSFADHQYYLFNEIERWYVDKFYQRDELRKVWFPLSKNKPDKQSAALPKARRKGLTYLISNGVVLYNFTFIENSFSFIGAYQEDFYETLLDDGLHPSKSWINQHTAWVRRTEHQKSRDLFKASYTESSPSGGKVVNGYGSTVKAASFGGTAFKGVGKSAFSISIEEAGKFNNLGKTWSISVKPLIRDGGVATGTAIIFGTSGEMDGAGGSLGLYDMAYNPENYNMVAYDNIYDDKAIGKSSLFVDDLWYYPLPKSFTKDVALSLTNDKYEIAYINSIPEDNFDAFDTQGNSLRFLAKLQQKPERDKLKNKSEKQYKDLITQQPWTLEEAFLVETNSPFDEQLAKQAKAELALMKDKPYRPGYFVETSSGRIEWKLDFKSQPILTYPEEGDEHEGCWLMFEQPVRDSNGEVQANRYIAGTDPIDNGYEEKSSDNKHSLGSTFILDSFTGNLVAEYTGRPARAKTLFKNIVRGLKYYSAKTMYENNLTGLFTYCRNTRNIGLLANEPSILKGKSGYKMGRANTKGFHATQVLNSDLREMIADWLEEEVPINQDSNTGALETVPRYLLIPSPALLDELIHWNLEGNFDRVSALMALMLYYSQNKFVADKAKAETTKKDDDPYYKKFRRKYMRYGNTD